MDTSSVQSDSAGLSVYQRVLGIRFAELDPRLRDYFGPIPADAVGIGEGRFEIAGATRKALRAAFRVLAWRRVIFPEYERDVPFTVRNETNPDGTLRALRVFDFSGRQRVMQDCMRAERGQIVDRLGRRGGLEVWLHTEVIDGGLRLRSGRLRWRMWGLRLPLPRVAQVVIDERAEGGRQRVNATVTAWAIGDVFRYCGTFTYELRRSARTAEFVTSS